jgi:phosphoesterase RecJ-like protein
MSLEIRKQIISVIKDKNIRNIAIVMHNNPDGDCIGSAVALEEALKYNGKKVDIIIHNKIPEKFASIIGKNRINKYIIPYEGKTYDILFMLDVADFNRTYYDAQYIAKKTIIIDHHLNNSIPKVNYYLNELDSSAGMTVYKLIKALSPITKSIATAIYLTIRSDTGNFKNANTTSEAHDMASELLTSGADMQLINLIYDDRTISYVKLMGTVLSNIKIDKKNKIVSLIISRSDIINSDSNMKEAGLIIDLIKHIEGIDMAFIFIENNERVIVKARSKQIDVSEIIKEFGGGGHKCSAGCIIMSDDVYVTKNKIIEYAIKLNGK